MVGQSLLLELPNCCQWPVITREWSWWWRATSNFYGTIQLVYNTATINIFIYIHLHIAPLSGVVFRGDFKVAPGNDWFPLSCMAVRRRAERRLIHNVLFPKLCFSGLGLLCCWHSASGFLWPLISAFNHFLLQPATACRPTRQWRMISYHGGVESLYTRLVPGSIPVKGFSWVYTGLIFPRPQLRANVLKTTLNLLSTVSLKYSTASARLIMTSDKWSSAEYKPGELGL